MHGAHRFESVSSAAEAEASIGSGSVFMTVELSSALTNKS